MKWEYLLVECVFEGGVPVATAVDGKRAPKRPLPEVLKGYGAEGWELAGVGGHNGSVLFLKRQAG